MSEELTNATITAASAPPAPSAPVSESVAAPETKTVQSALDAFADSDDSLWDSSEASAPEKTPAANEPAADETSGGAEPPTADTEPGTGPTLDESLKTMAKRYGYTDADLTTIKDPDALQDELTRQDRRMLAMWESQHKGNGTATAPPAPGTATAAPTPDPQVAPAPVPESRPAAPVSDPGEYQVQNADDIGEAGVKELQFFAKHTDARIRAAIEPLVQRLQAYEQHLQFVTGHVQNQLKQTAEEQLVAAVRNMGPHFSEALKEDGAEKQIRELAPRMLQMYRDNGLLETLDQADPVADLGRRVARLVLGPKTDILQRRELAEKLRRDGKGRFMAPSSNRAARPIDPAKRTLQVVGSFLQEHNMGEAAEDALADLK